MKPFYTKQMLVEMSTAEVQRLRTAVANEWNKWSDRDEDDKLVFEDEYKAWHQLYIDLTNILEAMPWEM